MNAAVRLLGEPHWEQDGRSLALPQEGPLWLIAFLACREEQVAREELLEVLYPDIEPGTARNRLRQLLHRARALPWTAGIEADAHGLRWSADCDVREFRRAFTHGDWAEAVQLYRGTFLENCRVHDSPELESWLDSERENLQAAWRDAALNRAAELHRAGAFTSAMPILEHTLELDPYAEEAVQAYLKSAAESGQPARAARVYGAFRSRLERDLGLEPEPATVQLFEALPDVGPRDASLPESTKTDAPVTAVLEARPTVAPRGSRAALTSFVGREAELAAIGDRLAQADCRLLTVVGSGGMGKTRLALEVAEARRATHSEVWFVPLETASSNAMVVSMIAQALGVALWATGDPRTQLLEALQHRNGLIVLDNFEQLLTLEARVDTLAFVHEVLETAPRVKLLITSRHRLELQSEWVVPLEGLESPTSGTLEAARRSSGARLFVERASRARPGFALSGANAAAVARICRWTDGLPLGLELAAAWVGTLEPEEIAAELEATTDLGSESAADRPARHHSLRAAFEHSWRLISHEERDALARLSVFRGGFERAGANSVAGASLRTLMGLVNKSLLRRDLEGRFAMLEVIRQQAAEVLQRTPQLEAAARRAHAEHVLSLIEETAPQLHGSEQTRALERLAALHDNARAALHWALETARVEMALRLAAGLHEFWDVRGHHREGQAFLEAALALHEIDSGADSTAARAEALLGAGWLERALGEYATARSKLEAARALWGTLGARAKEAQALHGLGVISSETDDLAAARTHLEAAVAIQREVSDRWGLATSLNDLGFVRLLQGDRAAAQRDLEESLELKEAIHDLQGVAYALANLGLTVADDPNAYRVLTERSLAIKRELGDQQGVANSLFNLGTINLETGSLETARAQLTESLRLFWQLSRRRSIAAALAAHAQLCALEGRVDLSARLIGTVDAMLRAAGLALQGVNSEHLERDLRLAREALGEAAYARAHASGRTMRLEDAVTLALAPPEVLPS